MKKEKKVFEKENNNTYCELVVSEYMEEIEHAGNIVDTYAEQMAQKHAKEIDRNFWFIVKQKPKWMPDFIYKAVIRELVELHHYK